MKAVISTNFEDGIGAFVDKTRKKTKKQIDTEQEFEATNPLTKANAFVKRRPNEKARDLTNPAVLRRLHFLNLSLA